jgi:hypothetical protein
MTKDTISKQEKAVKKVKKAEKAAQAVMKRELIKKAREDYSIANKAFKAATYMSPYNRKLCWMDGFWPTFTEEQLRMEAEVKRLKSVLDMLRDKK